MKLNELRLKIDEIDNKMKDLFIERMKLVCVIGRIKQDMNLPVLDEKRETEMIERNLNGVPDAQKKYYEEFLKKVISISKDYQNEKVCPFRSSDQL